MKNSTRLKVAAAVGAKFHKKSISSVYDHSEKSYKNITANVTNGSLSGYDYSSSKHFSGTGNNDLTFYDYETSSHVNLNLDGNSFSGYDYNSSKHFSGMINGNSISLYDYETSRYYNYNI